MRPLMCLRTHPSQRRLAVGLAIALGLNVPFGSAAPVRQLAAASVASDHSLRRHFASAAGGLRETTKTQIRRPNGGGPLRVTNCSDSGPGSLREIASSATDGSTIDLTVLTCSTITLASGAINFVGVDSVTLRGPGPNKLAIVGNGGDRIFGHVGDGTLSIDGLTLTGGVIADSAGGCVYSAGSVAITNSVVSSCRTFSTANDTVLGGGVYARQSLSIAYSTITANRVEGNSAGAYGGGVFAHGALSVLGSTISNNVASNSGGIAALSNVAISYSTISGNQAHDNAGVALFAHYANQPFEINTTTISGNVASNLIGGIGVLAETHIFNSTIADNSDGGGDLGAGLFAGASVHVDLESTIVAGNFSGTTRSDVGGYSGALVSGAHDLVMTSNLSLPLDTLTSDPLVRPLANNGGKTFTHALSPGSPAIDAGGNSGLYDQRAQGFARVVGAASDIGAYEVQSTGAISSVANCDDSGAGSLRNAVNHAQSGDTIDLGHLACSTITLTGGALQAARGNLTLLGPGVDQLTIDGNNADRVIYHGGAGTLTISGLTLTHGYFSYPGFAAGGCVFGEGALALDHARVTSCRATSIATGNYSQGGAIYAAQLTMNATTVSDSQSGAASGRATGGGIYVANAASIRDSTVSGNTAVSGTRDHASYGGGLLLGGASTIVGSTFSSNQAGVAGGVVFDGDSEMINSTVSGNSAFFIAGGVLGAFGSLSLYNSTIAFNAASAAYVLGAGLLAERATRLQSTIVFGNTDGASPYDVGSIIYGTIIGAHNLVGASPILLPPDTIRSDPMLGSLANNGGPTLTHALLAGSPAIDTGNNVANLATDQRGSGFVRVDGPAADIGAFEVQSTADTIFADGFDGL